MTEQELADELRQIADHPYVEARSHQLRDLAEAVTESTRLSSVSVNLTDSLAERANGPSTAKAEHWCEVDLFAAFTPEDTLIAAGRSAQALPGRKKRRMSTGAKATISSALVFVPILITWFGLKMATSAYGEALDAGGPEVARRPFLEMWQQGFDGRLFWLFKFDNIAACTLVVIASLIVWTVYESTSGRRAEDHSDQELARLRARLRAALTEATLVLGQVRLSSPTRFTAELTKAAAEVKKIGSTTRKVQSDLNKALIQALESAEKVSDTLIASATDVQGAVEALDKHLSHISTACVDMTASVRQTTTVIEATGVKTEQALVNVGEHLSTTVSKTTLDMGTAVGHELAESTRAVQDVISALDRRVVALDTHIAALDMRMGDLDIRVGALGTRASEVATAATRIEVAVDEARTAVSNSTTKAAELFGRQMSDTLSVTASEFRHTFGSTSTDIREAFSTTSTEIREALGDWATIAGAHAHRIETVSDTSGRAISMLDETREVLDRLPTALDGVLTDLPMRMKQLTDSEFAELRHAIIDLKSAVSHAAEVLATPAPLAPPEMAAAFPAVNPGSLDASAANGDLTGRTS
ncbi:hypothetical protein [Sphaerisporangium perillae]|uniref:hypothetical protein n=1 Tax=Sphaerisporangium perillae TaxID=2935860 RepID=UPI0020101C5F|nr:hypothetical protein [Sphaerisporangium perillae]